MFTRIYALLVCFFTMLCMTVSTGLAIYNLVKIAYPELMLEPYRYEVFQAGPMYYPAAIDGQVPARKPLTDEKLSEEELEALQQRRYDQMLDAEKKRSIASLIRVLIALLVSAPVFYVHWRLSQRLEAALE